MTREARINIARGLLHIDSFLQNTFKKGIFDIKLAERPTTSDSKRENNTNGGRLDH